MPTQKSTLVAVDRNAFDLVLQLLEESFKKDGLRGALTVAHGIAQEYDRYALVLQNDLATPTNDDNTVLGALALHIIKDVVPNVAESLSKIGA